MALAKEVNSDFVREEMSIEKKHGRIDVRLYYVLNAKKFEKLFPQWKK